MCEKENLYFIDMFDLLKKNDLEDGLHPNAKGHEKIFEKVKDYLIENKII
jgi:lysophospholipase L1-like esterase